MRNEIILFVLACQLSFFGCSGGSAAYEPPISDVAFVSADEAWPVIQRRQYGRLSVTYGRVTADGIEQATEPPETITIQRPSKLPVFFSVWKLRTFDGQRWLLRNHYDDKSRPTSISFADKNIGWIRTLESLFLTEDGGTTWTQILVTEPGEMTRIWAADKNTAYLYGANGKILRTKDRGRTWESKDLGVKNDILAFQCRNGHPNVCWVGTSRGELFMSSESTHFRRLQLPELARDFSISSIFLTGETSALVAGYSVGDGNRFGLLFVSDDNGQTWKSLSVPDDHLVQVAAFGDTIWLASYSAIYRSADAGLTWSKVYAEQNSIGVN